MWRFSDFNLVWKLYFDWITTQAARNVNPIADPRVETIERIDAPTSATFKTKTKLYVPVVTLSTENDKRVLEQLRTGFKRFIKWNEYWWKITNQTKINLIYLIHPTFIKVNRLLVLSFENENDITYFPKYSVPNIQIKDFNELIDEKKIFYSPKETTKKHTKTLSKWEETVITRQVIY